MTHIYPALLIALMLTSTQLPAEPLRLDAAQAEDGDTLLVEIEGRQQRIQLAHIDAPENSDNPKLQRDLQRTALAPERLLALGHAAQRQLAQLASQGPLHLHYDPQQRDRYGRLIGEFTHPTGQTLHQLMLEQGYALTSDPQANPQLHKLQQQARNQRLGLWALDPEAADLWATH